MQRKKPMVFSKNENLKNLEIFEHSENGTMKYDEENIK